MGTIVCVAISTGIISNVSAEGRLPQLSLSEPRLRNIGKFNVTDSDRPKLSGDKIFDEFDPIVNLEDHHIRSVNEIGIMTDLDREYIEIEERKEGRNILKKTVSDLLRKSGLANTYKSISQASKKIEDGVSTKSKSGFKVSLGILPTLEPSPVLKVGSYIKVKYNVVQSRLLFEYSREL